MNTTAPYEVIVVGLHLRWNGVWQRPNHILSRLKERAAVIVIEEELAAGIDSMRVERTGGIVVVTPERRSAQPGVDARTIASVRELVAGRTAIVWLYTPMMLDLAAGLPNAPLVYDKMDELAAFKDADANIVRHERLLCEWAVCVFAGGRTLWESVRGRVRAGRSLPSGVDVAWYADAVGPEGTTPKASPIFGYVGVIDERLDLELVADLARARPDATVVMVGPVAKIDPASLPQAPNIRYLGQRSYAELPQLVASFDVALMPFVLNEATRAISPTKTLEYLAAQRPVVSTAVPDVVADFADIVYIARDRMHFIALIDVAGRGDAGRRAAGAVRAADSSWDAIVETMVAELAGSGITLEPPGR